MSEDQYDVIVVGAGIAGSLLSAQLAPHTRVLLLDRSFSLPGSTGHAPGFVGELNALPALTKLARRSIALYRSIPGGFRPVGGMEVLQGANWPGRTAADVPATLSERAALAEQQGVEAEVLLPQEAARRAPALVRGDNGGALHFPRDGTADARRIAQWGQGAARAAGATLREADVQSISGVGDSWAVQTTEGEFSGRRVVVATGVWSAQLAPDTRSTALPVAHPYAYTAARPERDQPSPFVRFPGAHVYARDHGARDGVGSYAHDPVHVAHTARLASAYGGWDEGFGRVLARALSILPKETADAFEPITPLPESYHGDVPDDAYAFNGLFTVTPDGMPLAGRAHSGVWLAVGVWVTHAGGVADVLAREIRHSLGQAVDRDELAAKMDPRRFAADAEENSRRALATYNDIYNKELA